MNTYRICVTQTSMLIIFGIVLTAFGSSQQHARWPFGTPLPVWTNDLSQKLLPDITSPVFLSAQSELRLLAEKEPVPVALSSDYSLISWRLFEPSGVAIMEMPSSLVHIRTSSGGASPMDLEPSPSGRFLLISWRGGLVEIWDRVWNGVIWSYKPQPMYHEVNMASPVESDWTSWVTGHLIHSDFDEEHERALLIFNTGEIVSVSLRDARFTSFFSDRMSYVASTVRLIPGEDAFISYGKGKLHIRSTNRDHTHFSLPAPTEKKLDYRTALTIHNKTICLITSNEMLSYGISQDGLTLFESQNQGASNCSGARAPLYYADHSWPNAATIPHESSPFSTERLYT